MKKITKQQKCIMEYEAPQRTLIEYKKSKFPIYFMGH